MWGSSLLLCHGFLKEKNRTLYSSFLQRAFPDPAAIKVRSIISQNGEGLPQAFLVWCSPPDSPLCNHDGMLCKVRHRVLVLLATNVLSLEGGCENQKTMVESHHACI